jgi:general secretion pathway protein J
MALMKRTSNIKQAGMTLLEILVAMTLMVIIASMSYVSLNGLIDAKNHTDKVAQNLRQELLISQQLNQDMHTLINRSIRNQQGSLNPAIIGGYNSIEFSRNGHANPLNQLRANLQRVQWFLRDDKIYRRSINQLDQGSFPKWQERMYLQNIDDFNISYVSGVGVESRVWPLPENPRLPLKSIKIHIAMDNDSVFNYEWYPQL